MTSVPARPLKKHPTKFFSNPRARGTILKAGGGGGGGGGGLTSDSNWRGGWKHLFLSYSLKFSKKWGGGGWSLPPNNNIPEETTLTNYFFYLAQCEKGLAVWVSTPTDCN